MAKRDKREQKLLNRTFLRTFISNLSTNSVKANGQGFCYTMLPWLDELYGKNKNKEELISSMKRHNAYFNTNMSFMPFIGGLAVSMEKERALNLGTEKELDPKLIDNLKVSLQGPLAGLGDSLMFNTLRVISAGVAIPLSAQGSLLGPIVFVLMNVLIQFAIRYSLFFKGYDIGAPFVEKIVENGVVETVVKASSIVGLTMLGALVGSRTYINLKYVFTRGDITLNFQEILNSIMPNMLSLGLLGLTVYFLRKKISPIKIILLYLLVGVIFGIVGIF